MPTEESSPKARVAGRSAGLRGRAKSGSRRVAEIRRTEELRRQLSDLRAELRHVRSRKIWLETELEAQRHARQVLETSIAASYPETVVRSHEVIRSVVPPQGKVLVISRGDSKLVQLDERNGSHYPQDKRGEFAGHYPADSAQAVNHLQELVENGAQYLLVPNTAFWWLEHYRGFGRFLEHSHERIHRDEYCVLYHLHSGVEAKIPDCDEPTPGRVGAVASPIRVPESGSLEPYDVICFPIIDWDYRFQRPQQLMRLFAAAGHRVHYLTHRIRAEGEPYVLRSLEENLYEVSLLGSRYRSRPGLPDSRSRRALVASLRALQQSLQSRPITAMIQSAFWWPVARECAAEFGWTVVYDCMDYHAGFRTSNPLVQDEENELMASAALVVASSSHLADNARKLNRNVLLLRNACDYDHFSPVPRKIRAGRPVIGYYGAIAEWFDVELLEDLAHRRVDWDFILVGSTEGADVGRLARLPNVLLPGERPYQEIPDWLAKFDVAILPFRRTPLTEATNPVKAYEILAAGRPMVSVPLPEMCLMVPHVHLAATAFEFEQAIEGELMRPDRLKEAGRRKFAAENTWSRRFQILSSAIVAVMPRVATEEVVTSAVRRTALRKKK